MFSAGIADPEQLAMMKEALEAHCLAHNIDNENDKEYAAQLILFMFEGGARTVEEMRAGLEHLRAA